MSRLAMLSVAAAAPLRGEQGHCIGGRFHSISYDMSEQRDEQSQLPRHFTVSVRPQPASDESCPTVNGLRKGVCVGANTLDCHRSKAALPINDFLSCEDCFVGLVTDVAYDLEVRDFKPQSVRLGLENMHLMAALQLSAQGSGSQQTQGSLPLIGDHGFSVSFLVAEVIPVNINFKMPTELTYGLELSEEAQLRFGGDVDVALGNHSLVWSSADGWSAPGSQESVSWTPVLEASAKVEAKAPLGLRSRLEVEFERVLDYALTFQPALPLKAEADLEQRQLCLSADGDLELEHEAKLHFELFGHDTTLASWGPKQLYEHHWDKLFEKCWAAASDVIV